MKEIAKIIFYFVGVVVLGALLAPLLWWSGHLLFAELGKPAWAEVLEKSDFRRYFDRAILVAAIALLWPLAKSLRLRSVRELGLERNPQRWRQFFAGFVVAILSMIILGRVAIYSDVYHTRSEAILFVIQNIWFTFFVICIVLQVFASGRIRNNIAGLGMALLFYLVFLVVISCFAFALYTHKVHFDWQPLTTIFVGAIAVAILEEWLFRGAILGLVNRSAFPAVGLVFVSALFAIVHFLKPLDDLVANGEVRWFSGFIEVGGAFWQFGDPMLLLGGFSTLFVVGLILGYTRLKTRSLWMPIGLHAGWVVSKMSFSKITKRAHAHWPWFGDDILIGLTPLLVLLATGVFVWWWLCYVNPRTREIHL